MYHRFEEELIKDIEKVDYNNYIKENIFDTNYIISKRKTRNNEDSDYTKLLNESIEKNDYSLFKNWFYNIGNIQSLEENKKIIELLEQIRLIVCFNEEYKYPRKFYVKMINLKENDIIKIDNKEYKIFGSYSINYLLDIKNIKDCEIIQISN